MITLARSETLALTACAVLIAGCGTLQEYEGPKRASHEVAIIKPAFGQPDVALVKHINGKALNWATAMEVEVLPGPHTVGIHIGRSMPDGRTASAVSDLLLVAKAGRTYWVKGSLSAVGATGGGRGTGIVHAWVEDAASGEVVAGKKP